MLKFLGGLVSPVTKFFQHRAEIKHTERMGELEERREHWKARTELAKTGQANEHAWNLAHIRNSGWKDEFVLLIINYPIIALFARHWEDPIVAVQALALFPDFWTYTWMAINLAIYGIRLGLPAYQKLRNMVGGVVKK